MKDDDDRPVGYKRPPKDHRFPPGRSGNPKGRPPKRSAGPIDNSFTAILNCLGNDTIEHQGTEITRIEAEVIALQRKAARGDVNASKFLAKLRSIAGAKEERDEGGGVLTVPMPRGCTSVWEAYQLAREQGTVCTLASNGKVREFIPN